MDQREMAGAAASAGVMAANIVVGFGFQSLLAARLGAGAVADVFSLGVSVPTVLATAILAAGVAVLVPALEGRRQGDERGLTEAGLRAVLWVGAAIAGVTVVFAPLVARLLGASDVAAGGSLTVFLIVTGIVPLLAVISVIGQSLCLVRREYRRASSVGLVNGLALLAMTLVLSKGAPPTSTGLAAAVVCGYVAQAAYMWRPLRQVRCLVSGSGTGRGDVAASVVQLSATSALSKSQAVIERAIGSGLVAGTSASLGYANKVTTALVFFASFGLQGVALPRLAELVQGGETSLAIRHVGRTLYLTLALTVPVIAFGLWSSDALVFALFGRGAFTHDDVSATSALLVGSLGFVAFGALSGPVVNLLYVHRSRHSVTVISLAATGLGALLSLLLARAVGPAGITMGTSLGMTVAFTAYAARARQLLGTWAWLPTMRECGSVALIGTTCVIAAASVTRLLPVDSSGTATLVDVVAVGLRFAFVLCVSGLSTVMTWAPARVRVVRRLRAVGL